MDFFQRVKSSIKKISLKRGASFVLLGFSILLLFSLPLSTSAGAWDVIVGGLTAIPSLLFTVALAFILLLSQVFAFISGGL